MTSSMGPLCLMLVLVGVFISGCAAFSVVGNKILDASGKEIRLLGMCRPSTEWSPTGEHLSLSDYTLMRSWGSNVVRIALNQDFWFSNSQGYQAMVEQQVVWIKQLGMAVIIDLHWNNGGQQVMADTNSITFWTQVATKYKNDPVILFELYNEPHDVSWRAWRDGEGNIAGMQQLYNAVRATGANNVVLVGGLNYGYELSGVSQGYALTGTNIAYVTHPYDFGGKQRADWDNSFGNLAATYPIVMTEFGQFCNNNNYVSDLLQYITTKGIHFTAWAWYVGGCAFPSVIADWNGTPNGAVGILVKNYLGGSGSSLTTGTVGTLSTTASSITSTTGVPPPAGSSLNVYTDSVQNGFQDWGWADPRTLVDTTRTHSGTYSIKFALQKFGALYFNNDNNFQLGSYQAFQFWIFSTTARPAGTIAVFLYGSSRTIIGSEVQTSVPANAWTLVSASTAAFGVPLSTFISGVAIQGKSDPYIGDVWVDDILFSTSGGSTASTTTTTTATTASTTTISTTTTVKPTTTTTTTAKPTTTSTASTTTTTTAKPTTTTTTVKPTTTAATTAATTTVAATTTTTVKPTTSNTTTSGSTTGSSECGAAHIIIAQTVVNSWPSGSQTVYQCSVSITTSCPTKTLVGLTLTASGWNPSNFWGATASGNTITIGNWIRATPSVAFGDFGYQNFGGQASFTVASYTFQ